MTAEEIVKGLTNSQRWAMEHIETAPLPYTCLHGPVRLRLFQKGLLQCADVHETPLSFRLTPLGLEVRTLLQKGTQA